VFFGLLSHEKADERTTLLGRNCEHAPHDRVGSDRHAPDGGELDASQLLEDAFGNQSQSFRVQRDQTAVEVLSRLLPRR
jgi:hypothetical protein